MVWYYWKKNIYIQYINKNGEIPINSIIYNNKIYIEFKALDPLQTKKRDNKKWKNKWNIYK